MKRHKRAIAKAIGYYITCPYKACGGRNTKDIVSKGDIVICDNCNKGIHIVKVR